VHSVGCIEPHATVTILLGVMDQLLYRQLFACFSIYLRGWFLRLLINWLIELYFGGAVNVFVAIPVLDHFHDSLILKLHLFLFYSQYFILILLR
jgi:hypothetical protein